MPVDTPEKMEAELRKAKMFLKKSMQGLTEGVGVELARQNPNTQNIGSYYREQGYPEGDEEQGKKIFGSGESGAGAEESPQENKDKEHAAEEQQPLSKEEMTNPDALEEGFGPKRSKEESGPINEDGSLNYSYMDPETGEVHYQRDPRTMSGKRQLDRAAASPTYTAPDGTKHKQKDYDPYKERLQKGWNDRRDAALGQKPGDTWRGTGKPMSDKEKQEQENAGKLPGWKDDFKGRLQHEATKAQGKLAGKAIGKIAEHGTVVSAALIYGLALANDFPDVGLKVVEWFTFGAGTIADFIFDVVVTLGFRYFLRNSINVPAVKALLYSAAFLEILPGPQDSLPFWTICAWIVLRKIKEEQESQEQLGISREYAAKRRGEDLEEQWSRYGGGASAEAGAAA